jgi:protein-L-isoaspartate(D-aspartate) O-methyltransferase
MLCAHNWQTCSRIQLVTIFDMEGRRRRAITEKHRAWLIAALREQVPDERVLGAMNLVPREEFVPPDFRVSAYENEPLPIGEGQTISQPLIVAIMTEALQLSGPEKVLEVGTGSGYQAAVLSLLAATVISVERLPDLASAAQQRLEGLGYQNVKVFLADAAVLGWPAEAPYDAIMVTASVPRLPESLVSQLAEGGRLVVPIGSELSQDLTRITALPNKGLRFESLGPCRFVPLIGPEAWPE